MKKYILIVLFVLFVGMILYFGNFNDIDSKKKRVVSIEHFNICLVPDLSNRVNNALYPKPVDDTKLVNAIIDDIYPNILKNRVEVNQPDKIMMKFTSPKIINYYGINNTLLKFDFERFGNSQINRITYLVDRDKKGLFKKDKNAFKSEFASALMKARKRTCGADIWSFFNNDLNRTDIKTETDTIEDRKYIYNHKYNNIVVLFTDGYIEAGLYGKDNGRGNIKYHLSSNTIKEFRNAFKLSGAVDLNTFFKKNNYGLVPLKNPVLNNLNVLAVEFYDRSLTEYGNASVHPTDGEILSLFWNDWMKKSGVKRFKSCKITSSVDEFMQVFHEFAGIK
jgi:hypothetical protein